MQHATVTPTTGEVVMPETLEQCRQLYAPEDIVSLGDFGRAAGFGPPVLMTSEALHRVVGRARTVKPHELAEMLAGVLTELHRAAASQQPFDAYTVERNAEDGAAYGLLVRQNLLSASPFVLVSLA